MSQIAFVLRYADQAAATAALTGLGFDLTYGFPEDGHCIGADGASHYFNIDVYSGGTGILFDADGQQLDGFYLGVLWQGEAASCPDFGTAVCDPPPSGAPTWGRSAE